jgi:hypothetical protein
MQTGRYLNPSNHFVAVLVKSAHLTTDSREKRRIMVAAVK